VEAERRIISTHISRELFLTLSSDSDALFLQVLEAEAELESSTTQDRYGRDNSRRERESFLISNPSTHLADIDC
jgi:hypothetical protein